MAVGKPALSALITSIRTECGALMLWGFELLIINISPDKKYLFIVIGVIFNLQSQCEL